MARIEITDRLLEKLIYQIEETQNQLNRLGIGNGEIGTDKEKISAQSDWHDLLVSLKSKLDRTFEIYGVFK